MHPLVAINCAALTPELLANELFGHERGASGATERRAGLLASAAHGTVFFDEVGDLAPLGQAMLLRVLQEREVRPLGATAAQQVDVRVIAATNRDLEGATGERVAFRPDLYDRLSEVTIRVPSLRERADDIPRLAAHFLARAARRHGRPQPRLSAEALAALTRHAWPGNVRELEKAISRAVIFCDGELVRVRDLELVPDRRGLDQSARGASLAVDGAAAGHSAPRFDDRAPPPARCRRAAQRLTRDRPPGAPCARPSWLAAADRAGTRRPVPTKAVWK